MSDQLLQKLIGKLDCLINLVQSGQPIESGVVISPLTCDSIIDLCKTTIQELDCAGTPGAEHDDFLGGVKVFGPDYGLLKIKNQTQYVQVYSLIAASVTMDVNITNDTGNILAVDLSGSSGTNDQILEFIINWGTGQQEHDTGGMGSYDFTNEPYGVYNLQVYFVMASGNVFVTSAEITWDGTLGIGSPEGGGNTEYNIFFKNLYAKVECGLFTGDYFDEFGVYTFTFDFLSLTLPKIFNAYVLSGDDKEEGSGSTVVTATDFDIRDLIASQDGVMIYGSDDGSTPRIVKTLADGTIIVSGPLTDTELRASPVPISVASLPLPTGAATETTLAQRLSESDFDTKVGSLTETAPGTDTASSGLNGRLQRIAQRLTTLIANLGSPFQDGGSIGNTTFASIVADGANVVEGATADAAVVTDTTGTLSGKIRGLVKWAFERMPASLGQKTMANSLGVVISSDQSALPITSGKTILTVTSGATPITADTDIIAAVTSKRIKVISYAIFTDSTTQNVVTFKSNGTGGTALWVVPVQSPAAGAIFGANLTCGFPGFLFATAAGEKLTLDVSAATNIWYSLTYQADDAT